MHHRWARSSYERLVHCQQGFNQSQKNALPFFGQEGGFGVLGLP
jgi:hypothetical protein